MKRKVNAQDVGDLFASVDAPPSVQVKPAEITVPRTAAVVQLVRSQLNGFRCPRKKCINPTLCPDFLVICL